MATKNIKRKNDKKFKKKIENLNDYEDIKLWECFDKPTNSTLGGIGIWTRLQAHSGLPLFSLTDARDWSVQEVADYVDQIVKSKNTESTSHKKKNISKLFIDHQIDGMAFLLLIKEDLLDILKIALGHALKIVNAIILLRQQTPAFEFNKRQF